jgi:hypothetical protein
MKHLLVLFMAFSLIAACKNDKSKNTRDRDSDRRERDDYRSSEKDDDNSKNADYKDSEAWSTADVKKFNRDCLSELANNSEEFADKFCPCFLDKMQNKFSSYSEMELKSTEAQGKTAAEDCVERLGLNKKENKSNNNDGGGWPESVRNSFVSKCADEASSAMTRSAANNYCNCMVAEIEAMYPNPVDAGQLTEADMESAEMKRKIKACLTGGN